MKIHFVIPFLFFSLLVSCSNSENNRPSGMDEEGTLKKQISVKSESAVWTRELEENILLESLYHVELASEGVVLNPQSLNAIYAESPQEKLYPELKNFGSLENESIKTATLNLVRDFCGKFQNPKERLEAASYMNEDAIYSFVFFVDDIKNEIKLWENTSITFDKYEIGKSFLSGKQVQVPVRFYFSGRASKRAEYIDFNLYVDEQTNKILQIKMEKWGKK